VELKRRRSNGIHNKETKLENRGEREKKEAWGACHRATSKENGNTYCQQMEEREGRRRNKYVERQLAMKRGGVNKVS